MTQCVLFPPRFFMRESSLVLSFFPVGMQSVRYSLLRKVGLLCHTLYNAKQQKCVFCGLCTLLEVDTWSEQPKRVHFFCCHCCNPCIRENLQQQEKNYNVVRKKVTVLLSTSPAWPD